MPKQGKAKGDGVINPQYTILMKHCLFVKASLRFFYDFMRLGSSGHIFNGRLGL